MEIAKNTRAEKSKKQMNETLTAQSADISDKGNNNNNNKRNICKSSTGVSEGSAKNSAAETITTTTTITKSKNITAMSATKGAGPIDTSNKMDDDDMDIEIIEIPSTIITKGSGAATTALHKNHEKEHKQGGKLLTSKSFDSGGVAATLTDDSDGGGKLVIDEDIAIISISDGEDSPPPKPKLPTLAGAGATQTQKVNRKRSSGGGALGEDEKQQKRLKRRKIKVAGAPKMPLTGYVRYMSERREILRKELPTKTAIEHTKIIGEEWQKMSEERKAPYMKAAELDKQRYLAELNTFLKDHPEVLAAELAKLKQAKTKPGTAGETGGKTVLKEKSQSNGNIKSPNKETNSASGGAGGAAAGSKDKANKDKDREKANSQAAGAGAAATVTRTPTTAEENKSRRKHTPPPPPTDAGSASNSNSNNNSNSNSNSNNDTANANGNNNNTNSNNNNIAITGTSIQSAQTLLTATAVPSEIPIFTNEFLEHNKIFDLELRTLRKSKADLEQQNAVLEKHVENMKFGVEKMTNENDELAEKNRLLEVYLEKLKSKLAHALSGLAIPSQPNGATMDNIEKYMCDLYKMATTNTHGPASLNKAKDIIRKLDLQINL